MSTHWNVHCAKCVEASPLLDHGAARNGKEALAALVGHRYDLSLAATVLAAAAADPDAWLDMPLMTVYGRPFDLRWFSKHAAHALVLRSEYGEEEAC